MGGISGTGAGSPHRHCCRTEGVPWARAPCAHGRWPSESPPACPPRRDFGDGSRNRRPPGAATSRGATGDTRPPSRRLACTHGREGKGARGPGSHPLSGEVPCLLALRRPCGSRRAGRWSTGYPRLVLTAAGMVWSRLGAGPGARGGAGWALGDGGQKGGFAGPAPFGSTRYAGLGGGRAVAKGQPEGRCRCDGMARKGR